MHRLAGHCEYFRHRLIEGVLDSFVLALASGPGQLAAALQVRVLELIIGRRVGLGDLPDLVTELGEASPDLVIGQRLELGLEGVRLVDNGLDAFDLTVVGIDEPIQEAKHGATV